MTQPGKSIAILGAGIMGSTLALALARQGHNVTLFDAEPAPMARASRWNEGKIHLGYMYAADPTLETTKKILPGGITFADDLSDLVAADIRAAATQTDDLYLLHRGSVVSTEAAAAHYVRTDALLRAHPKAVRYLGEAGPVAHRRLSAVELAGITDDPAIKAGFMIPERSVNTNKVADLVVAALAGSDRIHLRLGRRVSSAAPVDLDTGPWEVTCEDDSPQRFDLVINALWEGKLAIDTTAGLPPSGEWSHRYRLALFVQTDRPVAAPSAIVTVGPFGDIKHYRDNAFYISWYPAGLVTTDHSVAPPDPTSAIASKSADLVGAVRTGLGPFIPQVQDVLDAATSVQAEGGWVFAQASGSLSDPKARIHRRDGYGLTRRGNYLSIDTGKYSTAPSMAFDIAEMIG